MRLVKVKRRSTAHYQRHPPPDLDWAGHSPMKAGQAATTIGSGLSVDRQFNRRTRLEADNAEWLRRTLERVTVGSDDSHDNSRHREVNKPSPTAVGVTSHQLRQMERDRLIREHRERGRSLLSWQQQQQQQQQQDSPATATKTSEAEDSSLQVKPLLGPKADGCVFGSHRRTRGEKFSKQLRAPPPPLPLSPTPYIQQALPAQEAERQQQQLQSFVKPQQLHHHRQAEFRRPRRLGGPQGKSVATQQERRSQQQLSISNFAVCNVQELPSPAAEPSPEMANYLRMRVKRHPTPTDCRTMALELLDKDGTLVQPRNPVNSPELQAAP